MRRVLTNPWQWIAVALFAAFGWYGVANLTQGKADGSGLIGMLISAALALGGVVGTVVQLRTRVVLSDDCLIVRSGLWAREIRRQDIVRASYGTDSHPVAVYPIAYPVLKVSDGDEVRLKLLAHRDGGGGETRVDGYVDAINAWLSKP